MNLNVNAAKYSCVFCVMWDGDCVADQLWRARTSFSFVRSEHKETNENFVHELTNDQDSLWTKFCLATLNWMNLNFKEWIETNAFENLIFHHFYGSGNHNVTLLWSSRCRVIFLTASLVNSLLAVWLLMIVRVSFPYSVDTHERNNFATVSSVLHLFLSSHKIDFVVVNCVRSNKTRLIKCANCNSNSKKEQQIFSGKWLHYSLCI